MSKVIQDDIRLQHRRIVRHVCTADRTEEITFECGHIAVQIIPLPASVTHMRCAQCINAFVKESKAAGKGAA